MVRISANTETSNARSSATSSSIIRVEWPTVKTRAFFQLLAAPIWSRQLPAPGLVTLVSNFLPQFRIDRGQIEDDLVRRR